MEKEFPSGYRHETIPTNLFPIKELAMGGAIAWFENTCHIPSRSARSKIENSDPDIGSYFSSMNELRSVTQLNGQERNQYPRGFLFGMILLGFQAQMYNNRHEIINPDAMESYFNSLLIEDIDTTTDPIYESLLAQQPFEGRPRISPSSYLAMLKLYKDDEVTKRSKETFTKNSYERLQYLIDYEKEFLDAQPTIRNTVRDGIAGFNMGFADYYWPIHYQHVLGPYVNEVETVIRDTGIDF